MSSTSSLYQLIKFVSVLLVLPIGNQLVWGQSSLVNTEGITEIIVAFGNSTAEEIKQFEKTKDKNGKIIFTKKNEIPTLKMVLYEMPLTFSLDMATLNDLGLSAEYQSIGSGEEKKEYAIKRLKKIPQAEGVDLNYFYKLPTGNNPDENTFNSPFPLPACVPFTSPCNGVTIPEDLMIATTKVSNCQPIKVAVLGTGIDFKHPLFQSFKTESYSVVGELLEDENGHETHIAGIIAYTLELAGLAPNTQIISIKTQDKEGIGTLFSMLEGIALAIIEQANVCNISAGYYTEEDADEGFTPLLALAFQQASNTLFVTSAGNDANNNDGKYPHYPSNTNYLSNVISMAALCSSDDLAKYSNYGNKTVDLAAYGTGICSASVEEITGEIWMVKNGTSMAASYGSATAALIASMGYTSPLEIKTSILASVDYGPELVPKTLYDGRLNAAQALNLLPANCSTKTTWNHSRITKNSIHAYPNPITTNQKLNIELNLTDYQYVEIAIANHTGQFCPLYQGNYEAGSHTLNGSEIDCPVFSEAGVYFLQVIIGEEVFIHKIIRF